MSSRLDEFADAARDYCNWCESTPGSQLEEAQLAIRHLSRLFWLALDLQLPSDIQDDVEEPEVSHAAWEAIFHRCAALPISYYSEVLDPLDLSSDEPGIGDLGDDLADIYRDLLPGLSLYRSGHLADAEWHWRLHFQIHWGEHASSALGVLHRWFTDNDEWKP